MRCNSRIDTQWSGKTDGYLWMHRSLIWMLKYIDIRLFYFITDVVIMFYMIFSHTKYIAIYHYFRYRFNKSAISAFIDTYLTFHQFGQVVIDRFATYAGQKFEFEISGMQEFENTIQQNKGCILLSSHIGNSEMAGYFFKSKFQMYVLLYGGEKGTIMHNRERLFSKNNIGFIYPSIDGSHIYQINKLLTEGGVLLLFGDRNFGSARTLTCSVLQTTTQLPMGPFSLAQFFSSLPTFCLFVMKENKKKYHIYLDKIRGKTKSEFVQCYADKLSTMLCKYPHQWYNFYEFWQTG